MLLVPAAYFLPLFGGRSTEGDGTGDAVVVDGGGHGDAGGGQVMQVHRVEAVAVWQW